MKWKGINPVVPIFYWHTILTSFSTLASIFPVSGAPQLNTWGAQTERPMISHRYPYSRFERPAPKKQSPDLFIGDSFLPSNSSSLALAALLNCRGKHAKASLICSGKERYFPSSSLPRVCPYTWLPKRSTKITQVDDKWELEANTYGYK